MYDIITLHWMMRFVLGGNEVGDFVRLMLDICLRVCCRWGSIVR